MVYNKEIQLLVRNALICANKVKTGLNLKDKANKDEVLTGIADATLINKSTIMWLEDLQKMVGEYKE